MFFTCQHKLAQLTAENAQLRQNAQVEATARVQLVETVRALSLELCEQRLEYRDTRKAFDTLWSNALDDLSRPI